MIRNIVIEKQERLRDGYVDRGGKTRNTDKATPDAYCAVRKRSKTPVTMDERWESIEMPNDTKAILGLANCILAEMAGTRTDTTQ